MDQEKANKFYSTDLEHNEKSLQKTIDHLNKELIETKNLSQQLNQDQENLLILLEEMEKKKTYYKRQLKSICRDKNNSNSSGLEISTDEEDEEDQNNDSMSNSAPSKTQLTSKVIGEDVKEQNNIGLNEHEIARSHYSEISFNLKNKSNTSINHQTMLLSDRDQNDFDFKLNSQYSSSSMSASSSDNISSVDTSNTSSSSSNYNPSAYIGVNSITNNDLISNFTLKNENFDNTNPLQKYFK